MVTIPLVSKDRIHYLGIILFLAFFFLWLLLELNSSSLDCWPIHLRDGKMELIAGEPRFIRSDEWLVWLPMVFHQINAFPQFSVAPPGLGNANIPFIANLPSIDIATAFRPQLWGYMLFGDSLGLSWQWFYKWWGIFLSAAFLVYRLAERSRQAVFMAVCAGLVLTFSDMVQWWFSTTLPESIIAANIVVICVTVWHQARTKAGVISACLLGSYFAIHLALIFYPPFQISLAYFGLIVACAYLSSKPFPTQLRLFRLVMSACGLVIIVAVCGYLFWNNAETLKTMRSTVYPGQRSFDHGGIPLARYFSGYYSFAFSEFRAPKGISIPEISSIVVVWPLLLWRLVALWSRRKSYRYENILTVSAVVVGLASMLGVPAGLESWTGLWMVQPERFLLCSGMVGWVALFVTCASVPPSSEWTIWQTLALSLCLLVLYFYLGVEIERVLGFDFSVVELIFGSIVWLTFALLFVHGRHREFALAMAAKYFLLNCLVNPLSSGTDPLLGSPFSQFVRSQIAQNPNGRWIALNDIAPAQAIRANGGFVLNGVHYLPPLSWLSIVDPAGRHLNIYNRYARIGVDHVPDIDDPEIELLFPDEYVVRLDICDGWLEKLSVDHVIVAKFPDLELPKCLGTWKHATFGERIHVYHKVS